MHPAGVAVLIDFLEAPQTLVADKVSCRPGEIKMPRSERPQRKIDTAIVSLLSTSASFHSHDVLDKARTPADELDAEAAYYSRRAVEEEQTLGPGYYVDLLRGMAADRTAMAQRLRTGAALRTGSIARVAAPSHLGVRRSRSG
jgi:hypothetical protein